MLRFTKRLTLLLLFLLRDDPRAAGGRARMVSAAATDSVKAKSAAISVKGSTLLHDQEGVSGRSQGLATQRTQRRWEQKLDRQFKLAASGDNIQATFSGGNIDAKMVPSNGQRASASSVRGARRGRSALLAPPRVNTRTKDRIESTFSGGNLDAHSNNLQVETPPRQHARETRDEDKSGHTSASGGEGGRNTGYNDHYDSDDGGNGRPTDTSGNDNYHDNYHDTGSEDDGVGCGEIGGCTCEPG